MSAIVPVGPQCRLRPFRVAVGLTLEQLRDRMAEHGVTVDISHLSRIERGMERASERVLRAWALSMGISPLDVWQPARMDADDADVNTDVVDATPAACWSWWRSASSLLL